MQPSPTRRLRHTEGVLDRAERRSQLMGQRGEEFVPPAHLLLERVSFLLARPQLIIQGRRLLVDVLTSAARGSENPSQSASGWPRCHRARTGFPTEL